MNRIGLLIAVGFWAAPALADAQELLNAGQLIALAAPARNFTPKDEFDVPIDPPSVAGKRFSYTIIPSKVERDCSGIAGWYYDQPKQIFNGTAGHAFMLVRDLNKNTPPMDFPKKHSWESVIIEYFGVACEHGKATTYRASNAFGVQIEVKAYRNRLLGIGFGTSEVYDYLNAWDRNPFFSRPASGDEARQLAANLRIRLSGVLGAWPGGRTLICGRQGGPAPTRDRPIDWEEEVCLFNGLVEKIEYLDASTGAVLATVNSKQPKKRG